MLAMRLQRTGRKGHAMFRLIVQDSHLSPKSGKVTARLGSYDPHQKDFIFDKASVEQYLANGTQPSPRVARLLKAEKVKLPSWVKQPIAGEGKIKNPEKRRGTRPAEPEASETEPAEAEATAAEAESVETPSDQPAEPADAKKPEPPEAENESAEPAEAADGDDDSDKDTAKS